MKLSSIKKYFVLAAALLLLAVACARVPYTERKQLILVSAEQETQLGETAFAQVKEEARLSQDPRYNGLIDEIGARIAAAANRPDYNWDFVVIEDPSINAFALPGGKVAFYTGILPVCKDEAGIATVMGHEVAHVLARHGAERLSQESALAIGQAGLLAALAGKSPGARAAISRAYGVGAQLGVMLPYSRKHESEADEIGLILMAKAGYDPRVAVDFWKRMAEQAKGGGAPELLSTHPSDEKRIERIQEHLPEAIAEYEKAIAENPAYRRPPKPV